MLELLTGPLKDIALWLVGAVVSIVGFLIYRGSLIRKGKRQMAEKVEREGMDRSLEAHRAAEEIREKERTRAKDAGDDPNRFYPGGVRGKRPPDKPPSA